MTDTAATPRDETRGLRHSFKDGVDKEKLKTTFDMSSFEPNAIFRGAQLTLVGAHRALQNPALFTNAHYKQAAQAVAAGILIRLALSIPTTIIRAILWCLSIVFNLEKVTWDDKLIELIHFAEEYVLQIPFFLMTLMRYLVPTLDNLFMQSLQWVDMTYVQKHRDDQPEKLREMYYPNLRMYHSTDGSTHSESTAQAISMFLYRYSRKALISLAVFALSYLPIIGRFVLPAASFYTFNRAVGTGPATAIFGTGLFVPRRYLVIFLQSYFSSRSLMRELLEPYFARIRFTKQQKRNWFRSREGVLFGFGLGFYILLRVPLVGVLIYGIAEASTAYLVSKVTDPPPDPQSPVEVKEFVESQQVWRNKHQFLSLSLGNLDAGHRQATRT